VRNWRNCKILHFQSWLHSWPVNTLEYPPSIHHCSIVSLGVHNEGWVSYSLKNWRFFDQSWNIYCIMWHGWQWWCFSVFNYNMIPLTPPVLQSFTSQWVTPFNESNHISGFNFEAIILILFALCYNILYLCWTQFYKHWDIWISWYRQIGGNVAKEWIYICMISGLNCA